MRNGHTGLNSTLYLTVKHCDGRCEYCGEEETVEHVMLVCQKSLSEREVLITELRKIEVSNIENILSEPSGDECWRLLLEYFKSTRLMN